MRARQVQRLISFLFCSWGWHSLAHSAPPQGAELEVLGEIRIDAHIEELPDGSGRLFGTLSDEVGQPIAGTLIVVSPPGTSLVLWPCGWRPRAAVAVKQSLLSVPSSGTICAEFQGSVSELRVLAQAPHFIETSAIVQKEGPLSLPSPQFLSAPQTLDLLTAHSVDLLAGPVGKDLPRDARLTLTLACPNADPVVLAEKPALGLRMLRIEFTLTAATGFGNCQLIAATSASGVTDARTTRNVLVRSRVTMELVGTEMKDSVALIEVSVHTGSRPTEDGIVQGSSSGAYLAGAPVKHGRATLEVKRSLSPIDLSIAYSSSLASLLAGDDLRVAIPARTINKSWTGLHLLALLLFSSWLAYHWLKPRTKRTRPNESILPPRTAGATTEGKLPGPLQGTVGDAHTGQRLTKVTLRIEAVGPEVVEVLEETTSDTDGKFKFNTEVSSAGLLRLVATAPTYMTLVAQVQSSRLSVHLTQRRHALVENLVGWSKSRGSPWFTGTAPTPGRVETTARENNQPSTESWAAAVASAAYSPDPLSESQVEQLRAPGSAGFISEPPQPAVGRPGRAQVIESKPETPS